MFAITFATARHRHREQIARRRGCRQCGSMLCALSSAFSVLSASPMLLRRICALLRLLFVRRFVSHNRLERDARIKVSMMIKLHGKLETRMPIQGETQPHTQFPFIIITKCKCERWWKNARAAPEPPRKAPLRFVRTVRDGERSTDKNVNDKTRSRRRKKEEKSAKNEI